MVGIICGSMRGYLQIFLTVSVAGQYGYFEETGSRYCTMLLLFDHLAVFDCLDVMLEIFLIIIIDPESFWHNFFQVFESRCFWFVKSSMVLFFGHALFLSDATVLHAVNTIWTDTFSDIERWWELLPWIVAFVYSWRWACMMFGNWRIGCHHSVLVFRLVRCHLAIRCWPAFVFYQWLPVLICFPLSIQQMVL